MTKFKKQIYLFGCVMWDIIGKPAGPISLGKDCDGFINAGPGAGLPLSIPGKDVITKS